MSLSKRNNPKEIKLLGSLILLLGLSLSSPVLHAKQPNNNRQGKPQNQLVVRSNNQAAQIVKSRYGGKVLKVESTRMNGDPGYRVKLLTENGRIIYVSVNAASGRIDK
ncbi:PepSY domain-containing protein [Shewanella yunxiaonensis]|uniref:PepSY domain-containing protein n=1 Tax=Shewanella yunxiaonensis TaxID=2829809 RepID=A0ABX7YSA5_9GAMM|nr:PepSY domain-containing protein [Shewanella yunxiaonensis]QUN05006.1 PepSY domain-containing protein [Shewanella yunxiaonensis]